MSLTQPTHHLEQIVSAIPYRVVVLDEQGYVIMVNNAWKRFDWNLRNIPPTFDWVGSNFLKSFPELSVIGDSLLRKIENGIKEVLSGKQPFFQLDYPIHAKNATEWFRIHAASTNSTARYTVITHSDIIKNKKASSSDDDLKKSKSKLKEGNSSVATLWANHLNQDLHKIIEESLNEIYIFDAESLRFLQVNRGGRTNLGYSLHELLQMTPLDIKPEFTIAMFREVIDPLLIGDQEKIIFNTIHQRKDRSQYPVEIHLQISTLLGEPVFVAIILDITESVQIKQELQEFNNHLEKVVQDRTERLEINQSKLTMANEMAKLGYWEVDIPSLKNINWSEGFFRLYDIDKIDVIQDTKYFIPYVHEDDRNELLRITKNAIKRKEDVELEYRIISEKGILKYIRARLKFLEDSTGKTTKLFGIAQDITQQKQIEIEIAKVLRLEQEMNQMKSRFVAMASHEFRTPLSTILSSISLVSRYQKTEEQDKRDKHIRRIKSSVQNLTSILNDFLSLEKLESNKIEKSNSLIDFNTFIEEIHDDAKLLMTGDQKLNIETNNIAELQIDPYLLKNILFNLLSNAIKYSTDHTDVDLNCCMTDGELQLTVKDYGIGIPESEHDQMFTRFFRASNAERINGTGLGLTIVKRYLDLLGGEITFDSAPGVGTTFTVTIPVS